MSPLFAFGFVVALASPVGELTYASPPDAESPTLEQHKLTAFPRGAKLFIASHGVNLRRAASKGAPLVDKLPFGAEVEVLARGQREAVGARVDHWYRVRVVRGDARPRPEGWLFGGTLTPFVARADLDGDGAREQVSASWSWRHAVAVRVFDDDDERARATWRPGASWQGGRITRLVAHGASAAGVPLVEIEVLIGDPDAARKTYWRVFYRYRPAAAEAPAALEEVFGVYRNDDVTTRVRFHPRDKVAEVQFVARDKVLRSERYPLVDAPPVPEPEADHAEADCFVHAEELPPLLPAGARKLEPQHAVEEQALPGGGRLIVRHGGCVHYTQAWTVVMEKLPTGTEARLVAAKSALAPFESAGPLLEALDAALRNKSFDDSGSFPCADATCAVEQATHEGAPALVVSYDVPL